MKLGALFAIGLCACGPKSGDDVPGNPDAMLGETCESAADCSSTFPICSAEGACVECETASDCPDDRPVCGNGLCTASCAGDEVNADFVTLPSDIIWIVDQSGSMNQETQYVQQQINAFAASISASMIDYRVVMIAGTSGSNSICVPAPLSNGACGDNTRFKLVNQRIGSHDGPQRAIDTYNQYSSFLRPEAMKHFIFVTDDESNMSATAFTTALANLQPAGMFSLYKVHGIYGRAAGGGECSGAFGGAEDEGPTYTTLITQTMGASGVICENDWTQVFTDIQAAVVGGSQVACTLNVPQPANGMTLDPTKVNVRYQAGGTPPGVLLPQVQTAGDCAAAGGWYYDDNTNPTTITLCPMTCTEIQADAMANVKIELGCSTQIF